MGLRVHPDSLSERFHTQKAGVKRLCRHAETLLSARRAGRQRAAGRSALAAKELNKELAAKGLSAKTSGFRDIHASEGSYRA
jgi:hypothetical protein